MKIEFKKIIFSLTLVVSLIFIIIVGTSYAYYNYSFGKMSTKIGSTEDIVGIIFKDSDYIDLHTGVPILSTDVEEEASKLSFTLIPTNNDISNYNVNVSIGLSDIEIDDELKTEQFKYRLVCKNNIIYTDGTSSVGNNQVFEGNAVSFDKNNFIIANLSSKNSDNNAFLISTRNDIISQKYECDFYMWLEETGSNQNDLMNRHFAANIEVNSALAKR